MQQSLFGAVLEPVESKQTSRTTCATPLSEAVFTVIDLETTGLNKQKNAITEVTAIQFCNGNALGVYSTLVQPTEPITSESESITGITQDMVRNAPPLISVLHELCAFMGPDPWIVGHNVGFDIGFLQEKLIQNGMASLMNRISLERAFCTKTLAQKIVPGLPSYEGVVVSHALGVHNPNPHRAEADVRMAAGILFALLAKLGKEGRSDIQTMEDLQGLQGAL